MRFQQFPLFGPQPDEPAVLGPTIGDGLLFPPVELVGQKLFQACQTDWRDPDVLPDPLDSSFNQLDRQSPLATAGLVPLPPEAEEVDVPAAMADRVRDGQATAALAAEDRPFEIMMMLPPLLAGVMVRL